MLLLTHCFKVPTLLSMIKRHDTKTSIEKDRGRPRAIDDQGLAKYSEKMKGTFKPTPEQSNEYMMEVAEETARRRGKSVASAKFSKQCKLNNEKRCNVKNGYAAKVTNARAAAAKDYFNFVTYAVMNKWAESRLHVKDCLTGNFDGSSFTVGGNGGDNVEIKFLSGENDDDDDDTCKPSEGKLAAPDASESGFTKYTVKIMEIIMGNGVQAPPIYILADDNMSAEEFQRYRVQGLGTGTNFNNYGDVIITKTRCMNRAAYVWIYQDLLVPFVTKIREINGLTVEDASYFHFDGEDVQLEPLFEPELFQLMEANNIWFGKVPGSSTHKTQACDVKNIFKGSKKSLKRINDKKVGIHYGSNMIA